MLLFGELLEPLLQLSPQLFEQLLPQEEVQLLLQPSEQLFPQEVEHPEEQLFPQDEQPEPVLEPLQPLEQDELHPEHPLEVDESEQVPEQVPLHSPVQELPHPTGSFVHEVMKGVGTIKANPKTGSTLSAASLKNSLLF